MQATVRRVDVGETTSLEDYSTHMNLHAAVHDLRHEAEILLPRLAGRRLWMLNSTEHGGGVAEMLPRMVTCLRELGLPTEWLVLETDDLGFFELTKKIHNLIHDSGTGGLDAEARSLYEAVNRQVKDALLDYVQPGDILMVHDPQPMAAGAMLKKELEISTVWRCHIGLDRSTERTKAAWSFLRPYGDAYDRAVFSAPEYIPDFLVGRSALVAPAIDPLSHKNRELHAVKLMGILCNAKLVQAMHPMMRPDFAEAAQRLLPDGSFGYARGDWDIGFLFRPIITQISRWDRLKGFRQLLDAFVRLKQRSAGERVADPTHRRRLEYVRLVLAGPDPRAIQDDPEGMLVFEDLRKSYAALEPDLQRDVAILSLPMSSRKNNALMVNVLQRASSIVVQASVQEGFGLTVTEAMWKHVAVLGTQACGIRQQIRDGVDGRLLTDLNDVDAFASVLDEMLARPKAREEYGRSAQRRVFNEFLVFSQLRRLLELFSLFGSSTQDVVPRG
ncbi:MAG: glycosyltransferase [Deltaproteobacteria bacterium]|nr:glycosyltransferase [Deltaproteobacteria bacterium]